MVARKKRSPLSRQPKISETFLAFAAPLTDSIGPDITQDQFEQALMIAFTVWNAVVFDAANGDNKHVSHVRTLTAVDPMMSAMIEQMIRRKREDFAGDHRLVGEYRLTKKDGEWRLWAEARMPTTHA